MLASIPIASWFGVLTVPHLLVAAFVVPALFVFFDAADFGALPTLVGRDRIASANSALWSTSTVVETVVPLAGGGVVRRHRAGLADRGRRSELCRVRRC